MTRHEPDEAFTLEQGWVTDPPHYRAEYDSDGRHPPDTDPDDEIPETEPEEEE